MLCLSGFELYSRWVPLEELLYVRIARVKSLKKRLATERNIYLRTGGKIPKARGSK